MAIVTHTFLDKTNTIIEGDNVNIGLNPILELYYGMPITRGLIHFDVTNLRNKLLDHTYPDIKKMHHVLKMQNVAGLRTDYQTLFNRYNNAERAASFDLLFFLLNKDWDMGRGFDFLMDGYDIINRIYSTQGSNWYMATNTTPWDNNGVYTTEDLLSHVVAHQHFDMGNESIEVDLTKVVNDMILGHIPNYGIGIAFIPELEETSLEHLRYVGFFTDHTHTFFHPYLETTYDDYIQDDRTNFFLDKENKLYFYASVGGQMVNLDGIPTCSINGAEKEVKQATKGVYYIDIMMSSENTKPETMFYDVWDNLVYRGRRLPKQELYFTTKEPDGYYVFGLPYETQKQEKFVPAVFGINNKQQIEQGDIRKVNVSCKVAYTSRQEVHVDGLEYRLYTKAGDTEIDVIKWQPVERGYNENYFLLNTSELVPGRYFIDIRLTRNMEVTTHKELCDFNILDKPKNLEV